MSYHNIVSIVTPSYNQGEFIEETIRAVLFQRGDFYIDYIIMDGGSEDRSVEIIEKYEKLLKENCEAAEKGGLLYYIKKNKDFRWNNCLGLSYRWKSENDRGQVHALKKGFRMAKGDIYYWLNSDDILVHNRVFQKVCDLFNSDPALKLLIGDGPFISKEGIEIGMHHVDRINLKELLYLDYHILQPSTFFRKDVYQEKNLKEQYTCVFDADFFIHMLYDRVNYKKINDYFGAFRLYREIKTLGLSKRRYSEQKKISLTYSKNIFFFLISNVYRYFEIVLKPRYSGKSRFFDFIFVVLKKISYKIITGKSGR